MCIRMRTRSTYIHPRITAKKEQGTLHTEIFLLVCLYIQGMYSKYASISMLTYLYTHMLVLTLEEAVNG